MDTFGARLAAARKAAKLSQEALAREVGVALMTISRYERDAMGIDDAVLERLAARLGRSMGWFRYGDDEGRATPVADDLPREWEDEIAWAAEQTGTGDAGQEKARGVVRSIGRMDRFEIARLLTTWKANQATAGLAHPKGADRAIANPGAKAKINVLAKKSR